ncbi:MAG TPA: glycosyltransferase family 39 protein, partial [Polyangiaceae bacterium]
MVCLLVVAAAAVAFSRHITAGGFEFCDEPVHAMDGVLLRDFLMTGPVAWKDPVGFTLQQYAHHPSLGLVGVYPPGYAMVEALFFAFFGVSLLAARLLVLVFALAAVAGTYLLLIRLGSRWFATAAAASLVAMPIVVVWSRRVMLEMPTLAVVVWLFLALDLYLDCPGRARLLIVALLAVAAAFFKQTALVVLPAFAWAMVHAWRKGRVTRAHLVTLLLAVGVPVGTYYGYALLKGGASAHMTREVATYHGLPHWLSWKAIFYYPRTLPAQAGWVVLALALAGAALCWRGRNWRWMLLALWFLFALIAGVLVQHKDERFFFLGYFPVAAWAGLGLATVLERIPAGPVRLAIGGLAVTGLFLAGYLTPVDGASNYGDLVARYAPQLQNRFVLYDSGGVCDGQFVFAAREKVGPQKLAVIRGGKVFYSFAWSAQREYTPFVTSREDVRRLLERYAIDVVFVELGNPNKLKAVDLLHQELADSQRYG